jgi:hypothetical protein
MSDTPLTFTIMLRTRDAVDFKHAGVAILAAMPQQGGTLDVTIEGRAIRGIVDALFVPPGCEENCVGTVFLSEG